MNYSTPVMEALNEAWHADTATNSLQRWTELADKEGWRLKDDSLPLMTRLFGASWYFTRFMFFRGADIIPLFNKENQSIKLVEAAITELRDMPAEDALGRSLENLRVRKNELMLSVLLLQLGDNISQQEAERLLTRIADSVLAVMFRLYELDRLEQTQCIILAMGRFAGDEMNYGSDLDLIFIEKVLTGVGYDQVMNRIRKMLRQIAMMDPSGTLYEIDMRLRPHGSSGTLITPLDSFIEFHESGREIWERQMMTRCRVVVGDPELSSKVQHEILDDIYQNYDKAYLASEIIKVRLLVEQELGGGKGKIELKRGKGGIMDIDFLAHYFQLANGQAQPEFRLTSTRAVIETARSHNQLNDACAKTLLEAYDFYKRSELALRVFDMKSISKVSMTTSAMLPLARATGFVGDDDEQTVNNYLDKLFNYRDQVRSMFEQILMAND